MLCSDGENANLEKLETWSMSKPTRLFSSTRMKKERNCLPSALSSVSVFILFLFLFIWVVLVLTRLESINKLAGKGPEKTETTE